MTAPDSSSDEEEEEQEFYAAREGELQPDREGSPEDWPPINVHSIEQDDEEDKRPVNIAYNMYHRLRGPPANHNWDRKQAGWNEGDEENPPGEIVKEEEEKEDQLGALPNLPKMKRQDSIESLDSDDEEEKKIPITQPEDSDEDQEMKQGEGPVVKRMRPGRRRKTANYLVEGNYNAEPANEEDHTFSGIMFDVKATDTIPIEFVEIQILWVRGGLGPVRVFVLNNSFRSPPPRNWTCVYAETHPPTNAVTPFAALVLPEPIRIRPGQTVGIYVHSALPDDTGIVYSNRRGDVTHQDEFLTLLPGMAHLNPEPFNDASPWGFGNAWRANREFCGKFTYGVKWTLWRPHAHMRFGRNFRRFAIILFLCNSSRNHPNTIGIWSLPRDTIFHLLHLCSNDWPGDMGLDPAPEDCCVREGCRVAGDKRCSRCHTSLYCSRKCQKEDWPRHKLICEALRHDAEKKMRMQTERKRRYALGYSDY